MRYRKQVSVFLLILLSIFVAGCSDDYEQPYQFSYTSYPDEEGRTAGFAHLPADYDADTYALTSGWGELPSGLDGSAIYVSGNNHGDSLFMFIQKQITGLRPETTYEVTFEIALASNTPAGLMGIGGSPGENVYVKAGVVDVVPELVTDVNNWLRMNIDKGNQASLGFRGRNHHLLRCH